MVADRIVRRRNIVRRRKTVSRRRFQLDKGKTPANWDPITKIPTVYEIGEEGPPPVEVTNREFSQLSNQVVVRRPDCKCGGQCHAVWHGMAQGEKCLHQRLSVLLHAKDVGAFETEFRPLFEMGLHGWCEILPPERLHDALLLYRLYGTPSERIAAQSVITFIAFERSAWTLRLRIAPCKNSMTREVGLHRKLWERYEVDPSGVHLKSEMLELKRIARANAPGVGAILTEIVSRMQDFRTTWGLVNGAR